MKRDSRYIFTLFATALLTVASSCSDNDSVDTPLPDGPAQTAVVTFRVTPYPQTTSSRDTHEADGDYTFGDASHIDVMVSAVYKETPTGYVLQPEFQKFTTPVGKITAGKGQNIAAITKWPVEYKFALDPQATYKIVFWSQNSNSEAFDISDLTRVEAKYSSQLNNDELRDAFTGVVKVKAMQGTTQHLDLHRPMAQINVGTTGWDFEGAAVLLPDTVLYARSQITLEGVAKYYNALEQKALTRADNGADITTNVTFKYYRLPAFEHLTDEQWASLSHQRYLTEEFLTIDRNNDNKIESYKTWEDYLQYREEHEDGFTTGARPETETYKYLSMCYVFVPEAQDGKGGVINKVKFEMQGKTAGDAGDDEVFALLNVPVQTNWRTNILGDALFVANYQYKIIIVPTFAGDFNNLDDVWQNVTFDETDENNWKIDGEAGNPNQGFIDKWGKDYYQNMVGSSVR